MMTVIARLGRNLGSVGRKGAVSAAVNAAASGIDLLSFAIVARILSHESLGIFLIALAVGTIVERVGSPNLAQTFFRHTVRAIEKKQPADLRHLLDLSIRFELGLLMLGFASGLITAVILTPSGDYAIFASVVTAAMLPALRPPLLAVAIPRAFERHEEVMGWLLLGAVVKVVILVIVMLEGGGMLSVAIAFASGRLVAASGGFGITVSQARRCGALSVKRSDKNSFGLRNEDFWSFTRTGAITMLPQAVIEFSTLLVGALTSVAAAGLYRLATKVGDAAKIYTNPISFVLYSEQCSAAEQDALRLIRRQTTRWCLLLGLITALGAALFILESSAIVKIAFGEGYDPAIPAITWCVVAAVPQSMSILLQFALFALGAVDRVLRAESIAAILFLSIIIALQTPSPEAAAAALAVSRAVAFLAFVVLFARVLSQRKALARERIPEMGVPCSGEGNS